jgi:hypothetical protein
MHGGDLDREINLSSDLDDNQGPHTMEYRQITQMLAPMAEAMKVLAAQTATAARLATKRPADGYLLVAGFLLCRLREHERFVGDAELPLRRVDFITLRAERARFFIL